MYLCRSVDGAAMCGVLDAEATMTGRLVLGYRDAVALRDSVLHPVGARVSGHEFHRTTVMPRAGEAAWAWTGAQPEGFVHGAVHASFLHTHPVANPAAVARFVASCLKG
jgi:cobyrinic acid a,c-diamide synthase